MTITWKKEYESDPYIGGMMKCIICKRMIEQPRQLNSVRHEVYCKTINVKGLDGEIKHIDICCMVAICLECAKDEKEN